MQRELFDSSNTISGSAVNLLPRDGEVYVFPGFFEKIESDRLFKYLLEHIHWQQDQMKFYGKAIDLPRLTA